MTNLQNTGSSSNPPAPVSGKKPAMSIRTLAYGGIFTALVLLATYFLKVPLPFVGYIHLGDGVIFIAAMILGPFAAIPAALGSGLADLIAGFPVYIPATVVIKCCMGLFAGVMLNRARWKSLLPQILVFLVAELMMVGGYFFYEVALYGIGAATPNILYNSVQGIAGIAIGAACIPAMIRFRNNTQAASGTDA